MALVTITEAAVLIGRHRKTISRHVKAGKVLKGLGGKIDTDELKRVYGEFKTTDKITNRSEYERVITSETISDTGMESNLRETHLRLLEIGYEREQMSHERTLKLYDLLELKYESERLDLDKSHERSLRLYDLLELKFESQRSALNIICSKLFKQTPQADPTHKTNPEPG